MDVAMTRMLLVAPQPAPKLRLIAYRKTSVDKFQAGVTVMGSSWFTNTSLVLHCGEARS
jgi:hypothetical protein